MKLPTPIKTDHPVPWCLSLLLRWPTLCFSLNKPSFTLLWLALESFPVRSQEHTLGSRPRDLTETCVMTILSRPTLFPARKPQGILGYGGSLKKEEESTENSCKDQPRRLSEDTWEARDSFRPRRKEVWQPQEVRDWVEQSRYH